MKIPFNTSPSDSSSLATPTYSLKSLGIDSLLFLFIITLTFGGLGYYGLLNNNEGLYAQITREMLENNQYVIPLLNKLPYIEKPPLLYWLIALSYRLLGISEFSTRFIPALGGLSLSLLLFLFSRWATSSLSIARLSVLIGSSFGGMIVFSRMVFFDGLLTTFMTGALCLFYYWHQTSSRNSLIGFYTCAAAAVLTKGFVSCGLLGLVILIFLILNGTFKTKFRALFNPIGMALFFLLIAPWHSAASSQDPDFAWFYFINEHVLRFLGLRLPKDYYGGPLYYYIPRLLLTALPWSLLFPLFLKQFSVSSPLLRFLKVWILVFFCFFSISQAKANYYLVTLFPPLALLLACKIYDLYEQKKHSKYRLNVSIGWILGLPLSGLFILLVNLNFSPWILPFSAAFFGIWFAINSLTVFFLKRDKDLKFKPEIFTALQLIPILWIALQTLHHNEALISARPLRASMATLERPYFFYKEFEKISSVRFYLPASIPSYFLESQSQDLAYGFKKPQGKRLIYSSDRFKEFVKFQPAAVIVFHKHQKTFEKEYPEAVLYTHSGSLLIYQFP